MTERSDCDVLQRTTWYCVSSRQRLVAARNHPVAPTEIVGVFFCVVRQSIVTATHCIWLHHTASYCNTLHTVTHCNTPQQTHCNILSHTATYCHTLQRCITLQHNMYFWDYDWVLHITLQYTAHCNTLHTVTHCNTLQQTHCNILSHTATYCHTLQRCITLQHNMYDQDYDWVLYITLQHTATHRSKHTITYCHTLQHTVTHCNAALHFNTQCTIETTTGCCASPHTLHNPTITNQIVSGSTRQKNEKTVLLLMQVVCSTL